MWKDSTTVLQWLNTCEKLPLLVANRVGEILESTNIDEGHQFLSGNNPADTGTLGIFFESPKGRRCVFNSSVPRN